MRTSGKPILAIVALLSLSGIAARAQDAPHSSGWVVIPVAEYTALRAKAFPAEREPAPPPVEATLSRVDYDLHINGELATGQANLTVDVLKDGWVRVPIPVGLLVREAKLEGRPLSLVPAAKGKSASQLTAVLSKPGRAVLALEIALPVASSAGNERLTLPPSLSGVTRASVTLARQDVDLQVTGGFLSHKSQTGAESKWLAYGNGAQPLTFSWRRKMEDHRATQPLRLRGSLTQLVGLGEESTSVYAEVNLEVVQGAARQARIQCPAGLTINQVLGAMVSDWDTAAGELRVTFLEPVEDNARFVVAGEISLPRDGSIDVPLLRLLDTERDNGGVAVEVLGAGEIKDIKSQGLERADAAQLGQLVSSRQSPSLVAFRSRPGGQNAPRSLTVQVARYTQQAVLTANIEEARYSVLISAEGKTLVQARYAVRNSQRNFVRIALPAGAVVWSSSLSGRPIRAGQAPDGSLLFPLSKARAGEDAPAFPVEVLYLNRGTAWDDKGRATLSLPNLDLPVSRTGMVLYYPPTFKVTAEPGAFRTETYQPPSSAALSAGTFQITSRERRSPSFSQSAQSDILQQFNSAPTQAATQALVDKFRAKSDARKSAGLVPIQISFPAVGPSLFLVSELTAESQSPTIELSYQRDKKRGAR
jgi:hypothetical protein